MNLTTFHDTLDRRYFVHETIVITNRKFPKEDRGITGTWSFSKIKSDRREMYL